MTVTKHTVVRARQHNDTSNKNMPPAAAQKSEHNQCPQMKWKVHNWTLLVWCLTFSLRIVFALPLQCQRRRCKDGFTACILICLVLKARSTMHKSNILHSTRGNHIVNVLVVCVWRFFFSWCHCNDCKRIVLIRVWCWRFDGLKYYM